MSDTILHKIERDTKYGPGPETQGGGYRGGPKRWTGRGPPPARHIPWPEIFKHHVSLIEGHLKMTDMVRKHTQPGTGNWDTITAVVDRCKRMLGEAKSIARNFVPPPNQRERVPLGVSSASMYPGYSPADHEYGKAAEDFGRVVAEAKARGEAIDTGPMEYKTGQSKGIMRNTLAAMREAMKERERESGSGSDPDGPAKNPYVPGKYKQRMRAERKKIFEERNTITEDTVKAFRASKAAAPEAVPEGENPYFVIDTNPTPVNLPGVTSSKRAVSPQPPEPVEAKKHKKSKKKHEGVLPSGGAFEDISGEVDVRMKEKEEKRKRKEEKKRKRESEGDEAANAVVEGAAASAASGVSGDKAEAGTADSPKKPKEKKHKSSSSDQKSDGEGELADRTKSAKKDKKDKKRKGEAEANGVEGEEKKRKKRKTKEGAVDA